MSWKEDETLLDVVGPTTMDDLEERGYVIEKKTIFEPDDKVFVLIGEYGNGYQEPTVVSRNKKVLEGYWDSIKESEEYVKYDIEEVPMIGWVKE